MIVFDAFPDSGFHLAVNGLVFSPDGRWLALRNHNDPFTILDSRTGERFQQMAYGWGCEAFAFSPDSNLFAAALRSEIAIHQIVEGLNGPAEAPPAPRLTPLPRAALESAGPVGWMMRKLFGAVRPAESPVLTEWFVEDRNRRKPPATTGTRRVASINGRNFGLMFPASDRLRYWDRSHCREWDAAEPTLPGRLAGFSPFGEVDLAPTGRTGDFFSMSPCGEFMVGYSPGKKAVAVWKWGESAPVRFWSAFAAFEKGKYAQVAISAGAELVAELAKARIRVVEGRTGVECFTIQIRDDIFTDIHLSANRDDFLASRKSGVVEVRSKRDGELIQGHDWGLGKITAVTASADGCRFAAAGAGKIVVWDAE